MFLTIEHATSQLRAALAPGWTRISASSVETPNGRMFILEWNRGHIVRAATAVSLADAPRSALEVAAADGGRRIPVHAFEAAVTRAN